MLLFPNNIIYMPPAPQGLKVFSEHKFCTCQICTLPICRPGSEFRVTPSRTHSHIFRRYKIVRACPAVPNHAPQPLTHSLCVRYAKSRLSGQAARRGTAPHIFMMVQQFGVVNYWATCRWWYTHSHRGNIIIHVPGWLVAGDVSSPRGFLPCAARSLARWWWCWLCVCVGVRAGELCICMYSKSQVGNQRAPAMIILPSQLSLLVVACYIRIYRASTPASPESFHIHIGIYFGVIIAKVCICWLGSHSVLQCVDLRLRVWNSLSAEAPPCSRKPLRNYQCSRLETNPQHS